MHQRSITELRQPACKQTLHSVFILLRGTAMLQSHSEQTNDISIFSKIIFIHWIFFTPLFYYFIISLSTFSYSLDVFSTPGILWYPRLKFFYWGFTDWMTAANTVRVTTLVAAYYISEVELSPNWHTPSLSPHILL